MATTKPKLTYFDIPGRGQPIRDAFKIGGVAFEDERISFPDWPTKKATTPFGSIPILTVGDVVISQSNSILRYVGNLTGLYPKDTLQGAKVDEIMDAVEDFFGAKIVPTLFLQDKDKIKELREEIVKTSGPAFFGKLDKVMGLSGASCGYCVGGKLSVADLKLYHVVAMLKSGHLDHIPVTFADPYTNIMAVFNHVGKDIAKLK